MKFQIIAPVFAAAFLLGLVSNSCLDEAMGAASPSVRQMCLTALSECNETVILQSRDARSMVSELQESNKTIKNLRDKCAANE